MLHLITTTTVSIEKLTEAQEASAKQLHVTSQVGFLPKPQYIYN